MAAFNSGAGLQRLTLDAVIFVIIVQRGTSRGPTIVEQVPLGEFRDEALGTGRVEAAPEDKAPSLGYAEGQHACPVAQVDARALDHVLQVEPAEAVVEVAAVVVEGDQDPAGVRESAEVREV